MKEEFILKYQDDKGICEYKNVKSFYDAMMLTKELKEQYNTDIKIYKLCHVEQNFNFL